MLIKLLVSLALCASVSFAADAVGPVLLGRANTPALPEKKVAPKIDSIKILGIQGYGNTMKLSIEPRSYLEMSIVFGNSENFGSGKLYKVTDLLSLLNEKDWSIKIKINQTEAEDRDETEGYPSASISKTDLEEVVGTIDENTLKQFYQLGFSLKNAYDSDNSPEGAKAIIKTLEGLQGEELLQAYSKVTVIMGKYLLEMLKKQR